MLQTIGERGAQHQTINLSQTWVPSSNTCLLEHPPGRYVRKRTQAIPNYALNPQTADCNANLANHPDSNRDEAALGNDRFITPVTLLQHPRAISSDL